MSRITIAAGALSAAAVVGVPLGIAVASSDDPAQARQESNTQEKAERPVERVRYVKDETDAAKRKKDVAHLKDVLKLNDVIHLNNVLKLNDVIHLNNVRHFNNVVTLKQAIAANEAAAQARAAEAARAQAAAEAAQAEAAQEQAQASQTTSQSTSTRRSYSQPSTPSYQAPAPAPAPAQAQSSGRCGGALPPCYVMQRESGGSLTAENPTSTAAGKWQFLSGTWNGYGGYSSASQAPESVQDAKAAELWAGGSGCSHWSAC